MRGLTGPRGLDPLDEPPTDPAVPENLDHRDDAQHDHAVVAAEGERATDRLTLGAGHRHQRLIVGEVGVEVGNQKSLLSEAAATWAPSKSNTQASLAVVGSYPDRLGVRPYAAEVARREPHAVERAVRFDDWLEERLGLRRWGGGVQPPEAAVKAVDDEGDVAFDHMEVSIIGLDVSGEDVVKEFLGSPSACASMTNFFQVAPLDEVAKRSANWLRFIAVLPCRPHPLAVRAHRQRARTR